MADSTLSIDKDFTEKPKSKNDIIQDDNQREYREISQSVFHKQHPPFTAENLNNKTKLNQKELYWACLVCDLATFNLKKIIQPILVFNKIPIITLLRVILAILLTLFLVLLELSIIVLFYLTPLLIYWYKGSYFTVLILPTIVISMHIVLSYLHYIFNKIYYNEYLEILPGTYGERASNIIKLERIARKYITTWLSGKHCSTLLTLLWNKRCSREPDRRINVPLISEDEFGNDQVTLSIYKPSIEPQSPNDLPIIIVFPGLMATCSEPYIQSLIKYATGNEGLESNSYSPVTAIQNITTQTIDKIATDTQNLVKETIISYMGPIQKTIPDKDKTGNCIEKRNLKNSKPSLIDSFGKLFSLSETFYKTENMIRSKFATNIYHYERSISKSSELSILMKFYKTTICFIAIYCSSITSMILHFLAMFTSVIQLSIKTEIADRIGDFKDDIMDLVGPIFSIFLSPFTSIRRIYKFLIFIKEIINNTRKKSTRIPKQNIEHGYVTEPITLSPQVDISSTLTLVNDDIKMNFINRTYVTTKKIMKFILKKVAQFCLGPFWIPLRILYKAMKPPKISLTPEYLLNITPKQHEVIVVNWRGAIGINFTKSPVLGPSLLFEVHSTIQGIKMLYPGRKLFTLGYSIGASALSKYIIEAQPVYVENVIGSLCLSPIADFEHEKQNLSLKYVYMPIISVLIKANLLSYNRDKIKDGWRNTPQEYPWKKQ